MTKKHIIQIFEDKKVRTVWDDELQKWFFSIVDVCKVLAESKDPAAYWRKLKQGGTVGTGQCLALLKGTCKAA